MNAERRLFLNARHAQLVARLFACAGACALVGACVGNPLERAKVDPKSPIASEVTKLALAPAAYPKFTDIPAVPKDIRPKPQFGQAAAQTEMSAAQLVAATEPQTWTLNDTDTFAASARQAGGPEIAPADPSATEAFAQDQRKRATPPPSPKR